MGTFLVDDDSLSRYYYSNLLQREKFEDVRVFNSGTELLNHLSEKPGIIFLDYFLGDYDGLELIDTIHEYCPDTVIVILSGQQDIEVTVSLMHKGVLDYIVKGNNVRAKLSEIKAKIKSLQYNKSETSARVRPAYLINRGMIQAQKEFAAELHDNINPLLATSKLFLDTALSTPANSQEYIQESKAIILTAISEIRTLCHSYSDESSTEQNIEQRLEGFLGVLSRQKEIKFLVEAQITGLNTMLNIASQQHLFLILKELVNNLIKYSNAAMADIKLYQTEKEIELVVKDYGQGFDAKIQPSGIGTKNVINRIRQMNGNYILHTQPGKGCTWSVSIPKYY
jgi:signal transduction histidine kinase